MKGHFRPSSPWVTGVTNALVAAGFTLGGGRCVPHAVSSWIRRGVVVEICTKQRLRVLHSGREFNYHVPKLPDAMRVIDAAALSGDFPD
ncbi:MAG: hypothetical protein ABR953_11375 [Candidatus Acidiferrales bacterium]